MISHAHLSDLVLSTYRDLDEALIPPQFHLVELIDVPAPADTQLAIFRHHHSLILAFPGTVNFWDWVTNISAALRLDRRAGRIRGPRGQRLPRKKTMHAWRRRWTEISPQVRGVIRGENPDHLSVTGHSLGGALAISAAASLYSVADGPDVELVTFAAPRAATPELRATLRGCPATRYEVTTDIVPRVPFLSSQWGTYGQRVALAPVAGGIKANHDMALYRERVHELGR